MRGKKAKGRKTELTGPKKEGAKVPMRAGKASEVEVRVQ